MASDSAPGNSYSGRPLLSDSSTPSTPLIQTSAESSARSGADKQSDEDKAFDLFSLISLSFNLERNDTSKVPAFYRQPQAVDSGKELGHGASFTVYRRAIPEHVPREIVSDMGGWTAKRLEGKENRPRFVVFKVPRIVLNERGEPDGASRHAMKSVLIELHALTHKPLMEHPNIVDCLGIVWVSSAFDASFRIPAIMVEYAEYGTLADVQAEVALTLSERFDMCTDVANGLDILHRSAIAHGDLKSENVLVFSDPSQRRRYVAKLADFGFSIVATASSDYVSIGGTTPWRAPEAGHPIARHLLGATDIYSFGLLMWRVVTGLANPFRLLCPANASRDQVLASAEYLKQQEDFPATIHHNKWSFSTEGRTTAAIAESSRPTETPEETSLKALVALLRSTKCRPVDLSGSHLHGNQLTLGQVFDMVVDCCLQKDPNKRGMRIAREMLRKRQDASQDPV